MELVKSALEQHAQEYQFEPSKPSIDLETLLYQEGKKKLKAVLKEKLKQHRSVKFQISVQVELHKWRDEEKITIQPWFTSEVSPLFNSQSILSELYQSFARIIASFEAFLHLGSGWTLDKILLIKLTISKFQPLKGGCRPHRLPRQVVHKRACLSIDCDDNKCFIYCILAHLFPDKSHRSYEAKRYLPYLEHVKISEDVTFPVKIRDIKKIEEANELSINVYGYNTSSPYPIYVSRSVVGDIRRHINLLLWKKHYYLIRHLSRLIGTSFARRGVKKYICHYCQSSYKTQVLLDQHGGYCTKKIQRCTLPPKGSCLKFENYRAQFKAPFVIYYDFECLLQAHRRREGERSKITKEREHIPIAFAAKRVSIVPKYDSELYTYVGLDCVAVFIKFLLRQKDEIACILHAKYKDIKWKPKDLKFFRNRKTCQLCRVPFSGHVWKCADHCHLTGSFRMVLCNRCNLTYAATTSKIPCIAHNCMGYDSHLFLGELSRVAEVRKMKLRVIAKNKERFHAIYFDQFVFVDSLAFLSASLAKLIESLKAKGVSHFCRTKEYFGERKLDLFLKKGVFCYEYLDKVEKLIATSLPEKEAFYDSIREENISDEDYRHALAVWKSLGCKTLEDYMVKYLQSDVLLLTDVYEAFRALCFDSYALDPTHYISLPHFGMDAFLKMTMVELELISDIDMYNFVSQGVRGGISCVSHRFAKANTPGEDDYDESLPSRTILFLDAVNLYAHAMCQPLPFANFRWLTPDEISSLDVRRIPEKGPKGYILEVDLSYPDELHDKHNLYPLAPEKACVNPEDWSPWMKNTARNLGIPAKIGPSKLISSLKDKVHYILHYRNLIFYLEQGMKLKKIHNVLSFDQKPWMADFIHYNTQKRKEAKTSFDQDFWKLLCNSAYGKLLEDVRKRINLHLVSDKRRFVNLASKPNFHTFQIINKKLVTVQMNKTRVHLAKPVYGGFTILELSKLHMYKFHYNYISPLYGSRALLLFTDTDSLCYLIESENVYDDIRHNLKYFDTSNYPQASELYSEVNMKKIGTFKDEYGGQMVEAFVGLRSKMYAIRSKVSGDAKKAKGLKRTVMNHISFGDYVNALDTTRLNRHDFTAIRSIKHALYTVRQSKVGLSPWDDKRYILEDGIRTLAHGHYSIREKNP